MKDSTPSDGGRWLPHINQSGPLHLRASAAVSAIASANDPRLPAVMVRGNELVRMTERGELEALTPDSLRDVLSRTSIFEQNRGEYLKRIDPPVGVARLILSRDSSDYVDIPRVDRVVDVPVLSADNEIITEPGYHAESRLYYRPASGLERIDPPSADTTEDVEWAKNLLLEDLLGDFGFADESSKAHALALLLLPFVREMIGDASTPLHVILAPDMGSGKSTLAQACLIPGCGLVPATPQAKQEEEQRKRITASLLAGSSAVFLDNLSGELDSPSLAAALTSGTWRDRVLGESREVTLPVRNVWVVTGNNLNLASEQTRRAEAIFLEPGEMRPSDRERSAFRHPELLDWAQHNRARLVGAALTLVDHWRRGPAAIEGGYVYLRSGNAPRRARKTKGSFARWAEVIGGILEAAEVPGFLENHDRLEATADEESREATGFLQALRELTRGEPLTLAEIKELCGPAGVLHDDLPLEIAMASNRERPERIRAWFQHNHGRWRGDCRLVAEGRSGHGHRRKWKVQQR